jgi:hypothetical protein
MVSPALRRRFVSFATILVAFAAVMNGAGLALASVADLATLSGTVTLADGSPVVNATLIFNYTELPAQVPVVTDANGRYSMLVAAGRQGNLVLYGYDPTDPKSIATQPSFPPLPWGSEVHVNQFAVPATGTAYDLTLPVISSVAVHVQDGSGQAVNGAQVYCSSYGSLSFYTIPGGGYLLDSCMGAQGLLTGQNGSLPLSVPFYSGASWSQPPTLTAVDPTNPSNLQTMALPLDPLVGTDVPVTLTLAPVGDTGPLTTLSGVVRMADGTPVQKATVGYSYPGTKVTSLTDSTGRYSLQVAPGLGELHVYSNDPTDPYLPWQGMPIWQGVEQPTPLLPYRLDVRVDAFAVPSTGLAYDVTLPPVDSVAVRVLDAGGQAVPWAKVTGTGGQSGLLTWPGGGASFTAEALGSRGTTADGAGVVWLPLSMFDSSATGGPVTLKASDPANPLNTVSQDVVVHGGFTPANPVLLLLPLTSGPPAPLATVTGRAFLPDQTPVAGALVRYMSYTSGAVFTTVTQADGTYSMPVTANQQGAIALYSNDPKDPSWWATSQPQPALPARFEFHTNIQSADVPAAGAMSSFDFPLPSFHSIRVRVVNAADPTTGVAGARVFATGGNTQSMYWATGSGYYVAPYLSADGLITGADGYLAAPFFTSDTNSATGPVLISAVDTANPARVDYLPHHVTIDEDVILTLPNVPAAPATVGTGTAVAPTAIDITWAPAANTGGVPLTGFSISATPAPQGVALRSANKGGATAKAAAVATGAVTAIIYDPTAVGATLTGLTPGTTYAISVQAMNAVGLSAPTILTATTGGAPSRVPDAPTGVIAVAGDALASVSWTAAADNGSAIQHFTVTSTPQGKTCTGAATETHCFVTGLANGQAYTFSVVATNGVGDSAPSIASKPVTPVDTVHLSSPVPTASGFTVNITNYSRSLKYTVTTSTGKVTSGVAHGTVLPLTVKGLVAGASATVTVTAMGQKTPVIYGTVTGTSLISTRLAFTGPMTVPCGSLITLTARLTQGTSAVPLADAVVAFTFNHAKYSATTDTSGIVAVATQAPSKGGVASVELRFDGDVTHAGTEARGSVKVQK